MRERSDEICFNLTDLKTLPLRGYTIKKDVMDLNTVTRFYYSPDVCTSICNRIVSGSLTTDPNTQRRVATFSPIIGFGNDGGWDSSTAYNIPYVLRKAPDEKFVSWGVTEKLERSKLTQIKSSHPDLPGFVQTASQGLFEEIEIDPCDVKVARLKDKNAKPPIDDFELEIITERNFSVDFFPMGVIINEERQDSPIALVIPVQINSNRGYKSRENTIPATHGGHHNLQSALVDVLARTEDEFFLLDQDKPADTWSRLVARWWLEDFDFVEKTKEENTYSLGLSEFRKLENTILQSQ